MFVGETLGLVACIADKSGLDERGTGGGATWACGWPCGWASGCDCGSLLVNEEITSLIGRFIASLAGTVV